MKYQVCQRCIVLNALASIPCGIHQNSLAYLQNASNPRKALMSTMAVFGKSQTLSPCLEASALREAEMPAPAMAKSLRSPAVSSGFP